MRVLMQYLRYTLILCICLAGTYVLFELVGSARTPESLHCQGCNVILISIDTLGANHLSLYDPALSTTPFLESIAKESFVFDNAYSQAPWTLPSHVSMLTGRYPWDLNIWLPSDVVLKDTLTLAEMLKEYGYETAAFSNGAFVRPGWGLDQGFDEFYGSVAEKDWEDVPKIFNESLAWLQKRSDPEPFFLLIRPFETHDPYIENGESIEIQEIAGENLRDGGPRASETDRYRELYRAEVTKTDAALKDFFEKLDSEGILDNTIVIITSDHGEEFGEHGTAGFHAVTLYQELLHVPLIIWTPSEKDGRILDTVEVRSIPATILDLVKLPANLTIGQSLVSRMEGIFKSDTTSLAATAMERETLLTNFLYGYGKSNLVPTPRTSEYTGRKSRSAIKGADQIIHNADGTQETFGTGADTPQMRDLLSHLENI